MILLFGDVHGNFDHVIQLVKNIRPVALIFLGDLEAQQPLELELEYILSMTEIYFIHGNHDTDTDDNYKNLFLSGLADRNIHGRIVEIDGVKVAGLGGVFREQAWYPRHDMKDAPVYKNYDNLIKTLSKKRLHQSADLARDHNELKHKSTIFYDDWKRLSKQRSDILVTHEAPSCHPMGFIGIDELARTMKVKKTFHGHKHDRLDYSSQFDKLGFKAFGVGFCGVCDQEGNLIAKGDFDDENERKYRNSRRQELKKDKT